MTSSSVADRIDELLPQTQCRKCGYAGCRPYAEAVAAGHADIYQCPPGGAEVAREMAELTGVEFKLGDARLDVSGQATVAFIDEQLCIGCTLCIQACPVDAIVGAAKLMHTVVGRDCTGCELCVAPCPVACIRMAETGAAPSSEERRVTADRARIRFQRRAARIGSLARFRNNSDDVVKMEAVRRAIERARIRLARRGLA